MQRKHWKRAIAATLTGLATTAMGTPMLLGQTGDSLASVPAGLQNISSADSGPIQYLPFAHFSIPFEVDPSGPVPREVHLWVSPDQGRSWLKYASTTPDKRSFEFHAAAEGEYLFAVQTGDGQGESALAASPPMRVLIDATQPELQLSADVGPAGQLIIDYSLSDPYLLEDSVRLAYSPDGQGRWEEVRLGSLRKSDRGWSGKTEIDMPRCHELDVRLTASDRAQNKAERVFHFSAPRTAAAGTGMQLASQRGDYRASDANQWVSAPPAQPNAGLPNVGMSNSSGLRSAQVRAGASGAPLAPNFPPQPGGFRAPLPGQTTAGQTTAGQTTAGQTTAGQLAAGQLAAGQPSAGLTASQGGIAWNPGDSGQIGMSGQAGAAASHSSPSSSRTLSGWTPDAPSTATARTVAAQPGLGQSAQTDNAPRLAAAPSLAYEELPAPTPVDESSAAPSLAGELELSHSSSSAPVAGGSPTDRQLPVSRRELTNIEREGGARAPSPQAAPLADAPPSLNIERTGDATSNSSIASGSSNPADAYHSRSRTFSLDYAVDSLRGAAVSEIELWGTEDQGRTWQKWGSDPDRQSPFDVQVGNDGLFGFRMVVIGSNGLVSNRPESGDAADMWINVDTQMPHVNITRALYGEGDQAGMLVIEFTGNDGNLHDRPVTLSYSERPSGPWVTIASGLAASGKYVWKPDPTVPRQVFLRAQAVDRAGNTQEHRLELPVNLRGMAPQGRIQGFRPIEAKG